MMTCCWSSGNHTSAVAVTLSHVMTISNILHHGRGGIGGYRKDLIVGRTGSNRHGRVPYNR
jgi:hypothetical protein